MTRQEQIEEMAKIVDEMYNVYTATADDIAEALYNAGYRIVLLDTKDGKVVDCVQYAPWQLIKGYTEREVKKARKETAKEILILLGKGFDKTKMTEFKNLPWYKLFCRELKQRYGVEVEE